MSLKKSQQKDWHPEDVKAAIRKTGISLSKLAIANGYSVSSIKETLRRRSAPVQAIIAKHLNLLPQDIWPTRYDEFGQPIDHRRETRRPGRRDNNRCRRAAQRQINEAV